MSSVRERLEAERARLQGVIDAAGREPGTEEGGRPDQLPAEQAADTLNRELDSSVELRVRAELGEVEAALHRLDEGRYGLCEVCGGQIAEARLEAMPATRYCVADQSRVERDLRAHGGR